MIRGGPPPMGNKLSCAMGPADIACEDHVDAFWHLRDIIYLPENSHRIIGLQHCSASIMRDIWANSGDLRMGDTYDFCHAITLAEKLDEKHDVD